MEEERWVLAYEDALSGYLSRAFTISDTETAVKVAPQPQPQQQNNKGSITSGNKQQE
jgi:hypothetical protein